ncbi:hypothetical protein [Persicitalea jodogahamensis]|uniref:Uncharacterized protein n=1 Tax=Persicitalea jodogahamensis TaxID=402147 RepID=A0A8J3G7N3_9BACT|nr:hypothetical protein [Persicitalea jodogahamensis]GHB57045.1 hypothetical protein GCM10007390_08080 [Persicitalea jodogahamensis]
MHRVDLVRYFAQVEDVFKVLMLLRTMDKQKKQKVKKVKTEDIEEISFEDFEKTMVEIVKSGTPKRNSRQKIKKRG